MLRSGTQLAIRLLQRGILFYTAGSRNGLERVAGHGPGHKKEVVPEKNMKRQFFVMEKCIEVVKQEEKDAPDLLELIFNEAS